jgi:hypothetical protein
MKAVKAMKKTLLTLGIVAGALGIAAAAQPIAMPGPAPESPSTAGPDARLEEEIAGLRLELDDTPCFIDAETAPYDQLPEEMRMLSIAGRKVYLAERHARALQLEARLVTLEAELATQPGRRIE